MIKKQPFFYIVLPTFNRPDLVIRSVCSVIKQEYQNYKLIIFNDGSSLDYKKLENLILHNEKITYIKNKNIGVNKLRNIILDSIYNNNEVTEFSYFFTLSDDDYLLEDALSIMCKYIVEYQSSWYCFNCRSNSNHIFKNTDFTDFKVIGYKEFSRYYKGDKHFVFKLNDIKNIRFPSLYFKNGYEHIFYYQLPFKIDIIPKTVKIIEYYDDGLSLSDLYEKSHTFNVLLKQIKCAPKTWIFYKMLIKHLLLPKDIIKNLISEQRYYKIKKKLGLKIK